MKVSVDGPTDLRGQQPDQPTLTWGLLGRALPLYAAVFTAVVAAVRLLFLALPTTAQPFSTLVTAVAVTIVSMTVLEPWFRRRIGLTREKEHRERVWAPSHQTLNVAGRQALRLLLVEWPVIVLSLGVAGLTVAAAFKLLGIHAVVTH